uniref:Uncharacterized protein n=1 Tax=Caenorhabditis tropicalis TaxID=1561998 RepID=A0A1I7TUF0_9PELO
MKIIFILLITLLLVYSVKASHEEHNNQCKCICDSPHQGGDGPHGHRIKRSNPCRCGSPNEHGDGPHGHRVKRDHGDREKPCNCKCANTGGHQGGDGPHGH